METTTSENKLLEFQKRVSAIPKDSTNPFFKSKYFDINTVTGAIRPILNDVGLVMLQPLATFEGKNGIKTIIRDGNTELVNEFIEIPINPDPQKQGSIITYFRRYALVSLLLLQGEEDDDANSVNSGAKIPKTARIAPGTPNSVTTPNFKPQVQPDDEWEGAPKAVRPLSKKQGDLILKLQKDKGLALSSIDELRKLTSEQASNIIEKLT